MEEPGKRNIDFEVAKGLRLLLPGGKVNYRSPFVVYEYVENEKDLQSAFDLLLDEVCRIMNERNKPD